MATSRWTKQLLDEASRQGDAPHAHPNADDLATDVMSHEGGVHRYNHLLEVADALLASPPLALTSASSLRRHLEEFSPDALRYFEPTPAPEWVDEAKLGQASALWEENSVAAIAVLYALSLPCTYLYKKGVPALYETGKLTKHEYIFQRIHETGLFVDDVMSTGALTVLEDHAPDEERVLHEVLRELDPQGDWRLRAGGKLVRASKDAPESPGLGARVEAEMARRRKPNRFLWGRGFLTARKVRFLHSSIRFMLRHPDLMHAQASGGGHEPETLTDRMAQVPAPWKEEEYGAPINQEELAFGLLSFGYLIPMGLERLGSHVSRERKEAFLHLWRVVGHLMGVREDLMTEDWDEATALLALVGERQFGHSDFGEHLTVALLEFARSYFPHLSTGLQRRLPAHLIVDQLGRLDPGYPAMVLPADVLKDTTRFLPRVLFAALMLWVRLYYTVRDRFVGRIPLVGETLLSSLHRSSEELIESWRDQFRRRPFDVSGSFAWVRRRGSDPETEAKIQRWRRKMFNSVAVAIACLFAMVAALVLAGMTALVPAGLVAQKWQVAKALGLGSVLFGFLAWLWMTWRLPRVLEARPGGA
jgi:hypothetical protein